MKHFLQSGFFSIEIYLLYQEKLKTLQFNKKKNGLHDARHFHSIVLHLDISREQLKEMYPQNSAYEV